MRKMSTILLLLDNGEILADYSNKVDILNNYFMFNVPNVKRDQVPHLQLNCHSSSLLLYSQHNKSP